MLGATRTNVRRMRTIRAVIAASGGARTLRTVTDGLAFLRGEPSIADLRQELEQLGPLGLWRETTRRYLSDHGFVQSEKESFAETMARALGINTDELRVCIAENRIGTALLERFREPVSATDNTT